MTTDASRGVPPLAADPRPGHESGQRADQTTTGSGRVGPTCSSGVPDAVYHLDRDWVLTYVNAAGEAMLGCAAADMLGRPFLETLPRPAGHGRGEDVRRRPGRRAAAGVRVPARALGPLVRDARLSGLPRAHGHRPRHRRARARRPAAGTTRPASSPPSSRRCPSATVLVDDDGRILTANRAWVANGELLRSGGHRARRRRRRLPGVDVARSARPSDHADDRRRAWPGCGPSRVDGPAGTFDYEYSARLGPSPTLVPAAGDAGRGRRRGSWSRHTDVTERVRERAGAGLAGRPRRADRPAQPRRPLLELDRGPRSAPRPPDGAGRGAAGDRPRRLQDGQRLAGPRDRRRAAAPGRCAAVRAGAARGRRRPAGRRPVPRPRPRLRLLGGRGAGLPAADDVQPAVRDRRASPCR